MYQELVNAASKAFVNEVIHDLSGGFTAEAIDAHHRRMRKGETKVYLKGGFVEGNVSPTRLIKSDDELIIITKDQVIFVDNHRSSTEMVFDEDSAQAVFEFVGRTFFKVEFWPSK